MGYPHRKYKLYLGGDRRERLCGCGIDNLSNAGTPRVEDCIRNIGQTFKLDEVNALCAQGSSNS